MVASSVERGVARVLLRPLRNLVGEIGECPLIGLSRDSHHGAGGDAQANHRANDDCDDRNQIEHVHGYLLRWLPIVIISQYYIFVHLIA